MPDGSFDFRFAHPFTEQIQTQTGPADSERLSQLRYHLNSNDYFAFLATVFGFLEESLGGQKNDVAAEELALVRTIRKDLVYLQNEYRIDPRAIEA